jgi:hypothetical protein
LTLEKDDKLMREKDDKLVREKKTGIAGNKIKQKKDSY